MGEILFIVIKPYTKQTKPKGFTWVKFPDKPLHFFKGYTTFEKAFESCKGKPLEIRELICD